MTPERWQQVKEIFNSAIRYGPDERNLFLTEACSGDTELRSEVESLISSHEKSGEFIDGAAYQVVAESLAEEQTELQEGQIIGSYEVCSFISRGGMGEVYLAQDKRLNRKVALKLLPASFTKDSDRLRRFEQEARAASALNHPNIITIYEISQVGPTHLIATEFVEGETLRQRFSYARLTIDESLHVAIQIADALAAAHKAGITHRDIKPENVMLRPDGYVKVLDFGLAKLSEQRTAPQLAEAPTIQVRTESGIVIGTAGYMSPEQARGLDVDSRSDIFSLGAVLYEMVAHRKPFDGETPSDTLASILRTEPVSLTRIRPVVPAELVRIITKALRKDREERYQVVKDLWLDLKALRQEIQFQEKLERSTVPEDNVEALVSIGSAPPTSQLPVAHSTEPRSAISHLSQSLTLEIKRHKVGTVIAALAVALFVFVASVVLYKTLNKVPPVERFWDIKLARITNSENAIDATISPDGKYIVYALSDRSVQSLYIRQVNVPNDKLIVPPAPIGFFGMTFSPDGTELYYAVKANQDGGTLYRIPVLGGTPTKVLEKIDAPISFSPDGKKFVLIRGNYPGHGESSLVIADVDGGSERILVTKNLPERFAPIFFTGPSWSPDGSLIASSVQTVGGTSRVVAYSTSDGTERPLTTETWPFTARVQWLSDMSGLLVVAGEAIAGAQIWVISYPGGKARRVTNDLNTYRAIGLTADGKKFSTIQQTGLLNLWVVPDGDAAKAARLPTGNIGFYAAPGNSLSWTPDGRIVFVSNEGGNPDIWSADPDGQNRKRLTANGYSNSSPFVSPDGRYVVYTSVREGFKNIWRMNVDGSNPIKITNGPADLSCTVSPDARWIIYTSVAGPTPSLWKVSIDGGTPTQITDRPGLGANVSPDGKLVAYAFAQSPDPYAPPNRLAVMPFNQPGEPSIFQLPPSGTLATVVQWSRDGKSLLYTLNASNISNIWSQSLDGGPPKQVSNFRDSLITGFAWSHDGKQLACTRGVLMRDAVLVTDMK